MVFVYKYIMLANYKYVVLCLDKSKVYWGARQAGRSRSRQRPGQPAILRTRAFGPAPCRA